MDKLVEEVRELKRKVEAHERQIHSVKVAWSVLKWLGGVILALGALYTGWHAGK